MKILAAVILCVVAIPAFGETTLIPRGATWKYNASGTVGLGWQQLSFDDSNWPIGPAQIGWGESDEQTTLFNALQNAPTTVYFRHSFVATNVGQIVRVTLRLLADDGAAVILNGIEVVRRNLPSGPLSSSTPALQNIETNENRFAQFGIQPSRLRSGTNVIAIEVHQHPQGLGDCSFDLELIEGLAPAPPIVTMLTPTNDTVVLQGDVRLEAAANDPEGHVTRVMYLTNGVPLGETTSEPYSMIWTNPAVGHYLVMARAYDNNFIVTNSVPVHVQVGLGARPQLIRQPYLQMGSSTSMTIRWRTDWYADSVVRYGTNVSSLDQSVVSTGLRLEHETKLEQLVPDTTYFYSVGSSDSTFAGGVDFHFHTSPTNARPIRVWVIGDSGTADQNAADVRDAYEGATGTARTDLWLMLGDNAYGEATDYAYTKAVFNMYGDLLRRSVLWSCLGNHDAEDTSPGGDPTPYLDSFTFPTRGEAGGVPSGTELYYSFDYGNVHFICLDSFLSDNSIGGPMLTWLESDLAATDKDWIIAFWHHPPYSWGTHDSDQEYFLSDMRERVVPILEAYGTDLVLSGHSHNYERTFFLNGHYGPSHSLQPSMVLDNRSGGYDGDPPYRKPAGGLGAGLGTVYAVCGCSGQGGLDEGYPRHPAMSVNYGGFGSMVLKIDGLKLTAQFLRPSGSVADWFAIDKSAPTSIQPELNIQRTETGVMASWPTSFPSFGLESADVMEAPEWTPVDSVAATLGRRQYLPIIPSGTNRFFRLHSLP